jgi:fructosamine-3-kinase
LHRQGFLNRTPITQEIRTKLDKRDYIKLKSFCTSKETIIGIKRQPTEWERNLCDLFFIQRINIQNTKFRKTNSKRANNSIKKWANELNRHFSKEEIQMTNKYMEKFSTPLTIKNM